MCADMSRDELTPMVFTEWRSEYRNETTSTSLNATGWPTDYNLTTPSSLTYTAVDDLFGFDDIESHPIFSKLPQPYNTVFNFSSVYGHESVYLLATSANSTYTMCSMRVAQLPDCFTEYYNSASGGSLTSYCGNNSLVYSKSRPDAPNGFWTKDWVGVGRSWGLGLGLDGGITDNNGALARHLTQLIPTTNPLNTNLPSMSEALAVLAGYTLILSSEGAPFVHCKLIFLIVLFLFQDYFPSSKTCRESQPVLFFFVLPDTVQLRGESLTLSLLDWNYTTNILSDPQYQAFNATLRTQEYMSGGQHSWQKSFYAVLAAVFATNVFCSLYFSISGSLITDFIEPQNLFTLSLNSPPSAVLDGSCGGNLEKKQLTANWRILHDKERNHLSIASNGVHTEVHKRSISQRMDLQLERGPIKSQLCKLGT